MLRSLYWKTLRDRWLGALVGVASLFLVAWMGLWAYSGMGDAAAEFIDTMPPVYQSLTGTTADAGVAGLMLGQMFNFLAPFVVAGLGISIGAGAIAGEESQRTMSILGSVPLSRTRLLGAKALAIATMVIVSSVVMWASYVLAVLLVGGDVGSLDLAAATLHLCVVALFYAAMALAIGAATGSRGVASGMATAYLVSSFLVVGFAPLFDGWGIVAKFFPWYVLNGSQPLANGVQWGQLSILVALIGGLMWVAWWRLNGRDLREGEPRAHFVDRLRSDPRLTAVISRLSGTGATGGIGAKALSDVRALAIVAGGGIFVLLVVMGPMFTAMVDSLAGIVSAMPEALLAMVGFADYSTAQGWYHGEGLSVTGPIAIAVVTISAGLGLVREERNRTIGLLHTAPISRAAVAWRKAGAMVVLAGLMGVLIFAGLSLGNLIAGLSMDYGNIAAASVLSAGLGCVLGAVAFAVGAVWGRTSVALGVAISVALLGWGINSFVAVNASLEPFARVSPFYYYSNNFPLVNGMDWGHALVLFAAAAVLVAIGVFGYQRRDLRG